MAKIKDVVEAAGATSEGQVEVNIKLRHYPPCFRTTLALLRMKPDASRNKQKDKPLKIYVFDVPRWEEFDLRVRRLDERLAFIQDFRAAITAAGIGEHLEFPTNHFQDKRGVFDRIIKAGGEGIVLKRLSSPYIDATSRSRLGWISTRFLHRVSAR